MDFRIWNKFRNDVISQNLSEINDKEKRAVYYLFWYFSDVNTSGHLQFFDNRKSWDYNEVKTLFKGLISKDLYNNFVDAYNQYNKFIINNKDDALTDHFFTHDQVYNKNEKQITQVLEQYAEKNYKL